jgi:hypothetical protein
MSIPTTNPRPPGYSFDALPDLPSIPPSALAALIIILFLLVILAIAAVNTVLMDDDSDNVCCYSLSRFLRVGNKSNTSSLGSRYTSPHDGGEYSPSYPSSCTDEEDQCDGYGYSSALASPTAPATLRDRASCSPAAYRQTFFIDRSTSTSPTDPPSRQSHARMADEEGLISQPTSKRAGSLGNILMYTWQGRQMVGQKVNSVVGAIANGIVKWTKDTGDEEGLLLPVTETERCGSAEV